MIDFKQYVVSELKSKRLSKANALGLLKQFFLKSSQDVPGEKLHPLVHRNTSDLAQQNYTSHFDGSEFFLNDHQVMGQKILPGVAYLEMVRAAVANALPAGESADAIELRNVVWATPIIVDSPKDIHVALFANDTDSSLIDYEVYSLVVNGSGETKETLHSQGQVKLALSQEPHRIELEALREQMALGRHEQADIYNAYANMGLVYGDGHKGIRYILRGDNQLLAYLQLPEQLAQSESDYVLHPSLMDSAIQAPIGFLAQLTELPESPSLPFAIDSVRIYKSCSKTMFAWVRYAEGSSAQVSSSAKITRVDIDLCDSEGQVAIAIRGFSSRVLTLSTATAASGVVFAAPRWIHADIIPVQTIAASSRKLWAWGLAHNPATAEILPVETSGNPGVQYYQLVNCCFEKLKLLLADQPRNHLLIQLLLPLDSHELWMGVSGLFKSAMVENPVLHFQILLVDEATQSSDLESLLEQEAATTDVLVKYEQGRRQHLRLESIAMDENPKNVFKENGIYLITGGLGGLGRLFAKEIVRQNPHSTLILTGRSALNEEQHAFLNSLIAQGAQVEHRVMDLESEDSVNYVIKDVVQHWGSLNGVIHSAGALNDSFIIQKTTEALNQVLAPKTLGVVNLDTATQALPLDFMVFFSSVSAIFGNLGQGDYAAANGFMDQFASYRNKLVSRGERYGKTLSINWPLWREGGMKLAEETERAIIQTLGMYPMDTQVGINAFEVLLARVQDQALVMQGDETKLHQVLSRSQQYTPVASVKIGTPAEQVSSAIAELPASDKLLELTQDYLRQQFAAVLKLPAQRIDVNAALEKYGIDSILAMNVTSQLEQSFGSLPKTLFFEYQTIAELTYYFLDQHTEKLQSLLNTAAESPRKLPTPTAAKTQVQAQAANNLLNKAVTTALTSRRRQRGLPVVENSSASLHTKEPIAIVGLSGRYPQSPNIDAFWQNLEAGRDCITEVPASRWDWREYYTEDRLLEGHHFSKWGGFIEGVDEFDPRFFNISPREAEIIDPQERLFLQHTWMAIEDAGLTREKLQTARHDDLSGQVGVYAGVMYSEYQLFGAEASALGKRVGIPGSFASIANRVSYTLNLHGPSMTLDTMCSSSLTAIHLACQDLKSGRTDLGIAGGVNVSIHPGKYLVLSAGQYISTAGSCQSFGEGGDGYIPGEGVGVVVLKRLADAERDGNHIYGLIRGSALNHGGKTNGYSVPNPQAQTAVIKRALVESGINPQHVSYLEAHGTGTKLGDPIEISALTKAFYGEARTGETGYCLLGSAKSNIGHCESAAGIAGLTKILLQLKHQKIVPSLHSSILNPHIDFDKTPFVVNQQLRDWDAPIINGKTLPRIAGLSSFGAGGSNAHLLIEEYRTSKPENTEQPNEPLAIVLSARTEAQLLQKVSDLLAFVQQQKSINLLSLAYTLQLGRELLEQRLAIIINSTDELIEKLSAVIAGDTSIADVYRGRVNPDSDEINLLRQDEDMRSAIARWVERRKYSRLLELWVKGLDIDWTVFYPVQPGLISLPTYPFAKERYWVDGITGGLGQLVTASGRNLHPLLHQNLSNLQEQAYQSHFNGKEFFLADHQVVLPGTTEKTAHKILPAVAYLEMARAAVEQAVGGLPEGIHIVLKDILWLKPMAVENSTTVLLKLNLDQEDHIGFQIFQADDNIFCRGSVELQSLATASTIDLAILANELQDELATNHIYQIYQDMGINYGSSFRSIKQLRRNNSNVLAELQVPASQTSLLTQTLLHPSLMDGALQAALGLVADVQSLSSSPILPFALERLEIHAACEQQMYAWVRYAAGNTSRDSVIRLDIDLINARGQVCISLQGLISRVVEGQQLQTSSPVLFAAPEWQSVSDKSLMSAPTLTPATSAQLLVIAHPSIDTGSLQTDLASSIGHVEIRRIDPDLLASLAEAGYKSLASYTFELLKELCAQISTQPIVVQWLLSSNDSLAMGLSGLLKTVAIENPKIIGQIILMDEFIQLPARIIDNLRSQQSQVIRYQNNQCEVLGWQTLEWGADAMAYRDGGVYLITGGTGGLGLEFARDILAKTQGSKIILAGRASESEKHKQLVENLTTATNQVVYRQLDLANIEQVQSSVSAIENEFGGITGIIHSAGMTADNFLIRKTPEEFSAVLEPKVSGTYALDIATKNSPLDFMVFFSSVSSALGNPGQSDYAAANGFMDQFAHTRNQWVAAGERKGHTLSINWPLWQSGGMTVDEQTLAILKQVSGVVPMQSSIGIHTFHQSIAQQLTQALVMEGDIVKLKATLFGQPDKIIRPVSENNIGKNIESIPDELVEHTHKYLKNIFSSALKLPASEIDVRASLENYGIDSVIAMKLTAELETAFGSMSKTLFFEYQTISALADYLISEFPTEIMNKLGSSTQAIASKPIQVVNSTAHSSHQLLTHKKANIFGKTHSMGVKDIAIIGVAGRYPDAEDLDAFWNNLKTGRDCISEIPAERWSVEPYFDARQNQLGKTYSKWGGFVPHGDKFDPLFFNISPKEAEFLDPQERLFMQTAWHTFEDAGYTRESLSGHRIGVYVGVMWGHYELYGADVLALGNMNVPGSSYASIANRVSYFYDLRGPSLALDTMCSSSLTAIHLACEAIRTGEIEAALAGGVNLSVHPQKYINLSQGNFAATDGRCRSFGEGGDGYVPGEGVGAIMLKTLNQAEADGDRIYAVIKATAINHGGKTNGYTVPNPVAQGELISEALHKARIDASSLSYIETHGTGTALGDPIEINGLNRAFRNTTDARQICAIGSVKSNIGHLESAAGIAAITKVLLQFKHQQLVPSLHANPVNPNIDFANSPFYVQQSLGTWEKQGNAPRRAGVSSFGAGGSNAHIILEEYIQAARLSHEGSAQLVLISARNHPVLDEYVGLYRQFLNQYPNLDLADIAYTTQLGRSPMKSRLAVIANTIEDLYEKLGQWQDNRQANIFVSEEHGKNNASRLLDGKAGSDFLNSLLQERELEKLARLWIEGAEINWALLHQQTGHKIALPLYPFVKERYWIKTTTKSAAPTSLTSSSKNSAPPEQPTTLYYRPVWKADPIAISTQLIPGNIMLINVPGILAETINTLKASQQSIVSVTHATEFMGTGNYYSLDLKNAGDIESLIVALENHQALPQHIIWYLDESTSPVDIFQSHLLLLKSLMARKGHGGVRLLAVSFADKHPLPAHSALTGLYKTLGIENPKYTARLLEVATENTDSLTSCVLSELTQASWNNSWNSKHVRINASGVREINHVEPFQPAATLNAAVKQAGVYIISGGMGGLGFIFAEYLVREFSAKLVLMGRSALDTELQQKLERLQGYAGQVIYIQADVSLLEDVEQATQTAREHFGTINGVFHSAGANRDAYLINKSLDDIPSVLAPKILGATNLDQATCNDNLDLFVLFSSTASVTGNPGQGDYAFANAYLDSFATLRNQHLADKNRFGKTLSINWPYWVDGGMKLSAQALANLQQQTGMQPLATKNGLHIWETLLGEDISQAAVFFGMPSVIRSRLEASRQKIELPIQKVPAKNTSLIAESRRYLQSLIGDEINLAVDRLDVDERIDSFGIDSVVINRINARLEIDLGELPKTLFYEYQTIADLAQYLVAEKAGSLANILSPTTANDIQNVDAEEPDEIVTMPVIAHQETGIYSYTPTEPIAIIGVHGQHPGSETLDDYWENLKNGSNLVTVIPTDRWDAEALYHPDPEKATEGKLYCKWGGFLDNVDCFDAGFFNISAAEANFMDPQERLFLQSVWSAFENAGYTRERLKKSYTKGNSANVGVFVGVTTNTYQLLGAEQWNRGNMVNPASLPWSIANRVSYYFDFQGPSVPVDTACSSVLVAIDMACQSLQRGDCQIAVAGGVNLYLHPAKYLSLCQRRMISPNGITASFGAGEDGFVPAEAVGSLILKPLSRAEQDGDFIQGVIRASGYEHAGRSNGYTAPNPNSMASLIESTLQKGGVHPQTISYVEGHGTGTQLGDSLEVAAMTKAFGQDLKDKQSCALGSVKSNMGHAEAASGVAGITKILLQMKHGQIAPSLHAETVNPNIDFTQTPFYLQRTLTDWIGREGPRRAMINASGSGGVNACVIIEEYTPSQPTKPLDTEQLFVLSARTGEQLQQYAQAMAKTIQAESFSLEQICYTAQVGREAMKHKLAIVVSNLDQLVAALVAFNPAHNFFSAGKWSNLTALEEKPSHAQLLNWFNGAQWQSLAQPWLDGTPIHWFEFYASSRIQRVPLATYPFNREQHWLTESRGAKLSAPTPSSGIGKQLHPLVSYNSSTLREISFTSHLQKNAFYATEHQVNGKRIFPGAGFLEVANIAGCIGGEARVHKIQDIVWIQPLVFGEQDQSVQIHLKPIGDAAEYVITSSQDFETRVHTEGKLVFEKSGQLLSEETMDLDALFANCHQSMPGTEFYKATREYGFLYQGGFCAIQELQLGKGYALTTLKLAQHLVKDSQDYILHPCILDGAFQSVSALMVAENPGVAQVPFAIEEVEIFGSIPPSCYAHVERCDKNEKKTDSVVSYNIKILNPAGSVVVSIRNFYVRSMTISAPKMEPGFQEM